VNANFSRIRRVVISGKYKKRQTKNEKNPNQANSKKIASLLYSIAEMLGKSSLIEKTPENTFRLE
jgi:hypothetical protein